MQLHVYPAAAFSANPVLLYAFRRNDRPKARWGPGATAINAAGLCFFFLPYRSRNSSLPKYVNIYKRLGTLHLYTRITGTIFSGVDLHGGDGDLDPGPFVVAAILALVGLDALA
jgi:hypothetical protein